jgi:acyl-coenzyme A synthetase/AMP-(fatty) acid ligase
LEPDDVTYGPTALSSSYQLVANLLPGLHRGAEVCVAPGWPGPGNGWDDLERLGATVVVANPTVLTAILSASQDRDRGRPPARLRLGLSGGGPVPPVLKAAWRDELGLTLAESFGQSELGGFFGLGGTDPLPDRLLAACGRPLPDKELRIVDDDDREVPVGQLGEIALRGGFMTGYWRRPEKTAETLRNGWLHSGDVGFVDRDGYLHMRGRLSERLTVAGRHWYPRDVEEALLRHPAVTAAALIGVPDPDLGQRPVAFVTLGDGFGDPPATDDLVARLAVAERPPGLEVRIVASLPMTPTGKISKAQLQARYGADLTT